MATGKRFLSHLSMQWGSFIILTITAALVYNQFFLARAYVELELTVNRTTTLEMFWAAAGEQYSQSHKGQTIIKPGRSHYGFFLDDLRKIKKIRLDPVGNKYQATISISRITISQPGMTDLVFATETDFNRFVVGRDIASHSFAPDRGWTVVSTGGNPHFFSEIDGGGRSFNIPAESARFLILLAFLWLVLRAFSPLVHEYNYISLLAFAVLSMIVIMAITSWSNQHPDEMVHADAAAYYEDHWLMPAVDAPEIAHTYSGYGHSRLNSTEICYFLNGKLAQLLAPFHLPSYQRYRFFNILLFTVLALLTIQSRTARLIFIPLLMTPQAWYLFSYCNSDAFALFTAMIAAYQLSEEGSLFHRMIAGKIRIWQAVLLLAPLVAALFLIKKNYYFFLIAIFFYLVSAFGFRRYQVSTAIFKKLLLLSCVGILLVGVRYGADIRVNGFDKAEKIKKMQEQRAYKPYKPSTTLNEKHPNLNLKGRGVSFKQYLKEYRWGGHIIRSFYGVYGYMTIAASSDYYDLMRNSGFLFIAFIILSIIFHGGWWENGLLVNVLICCLALIGTACYRSWIIDFQPQGRYVMAILPMLGLLIAHTERLFSPLILRAFILFMFLMSSSNFLFIGLPGIAKYGWG